MTYLRHRKRMVAQSVFNDVVRVLRNTGWLPSDWTPQSGSTTHATFHNTLLGKSALSLIDYFPDQTQGKKIEKNTLAMNAGDPAEPYENQLGGGPMAYGQEYQFHFAFWAVSDACADALFQDLADRYNGLTDAPFLSLFNYTVSPPTEVVRMECESFAWTESSDQVAANGQRLYFGRLLLTDYLDETDRTGS